MKQTKQQIPQRGDVVTPSEVADLLGVTVQAVVKRLNNGTLPGFRLFGDTGQWRMCRDDVERILAKRRATLKKEPDPHQPHQNGTEGE